MSKKTAILFLLALALATAPLLGQRLTDDRELFTGVASKSRVFPNIVILADSSGSMRLVINHPDYDPRYNYKKASPANPSAPEVYTLSGLGTVGIDNDPSTGLLRLQENQSFFICRGRSSGTWVWDVRAIFSSVPNNPPHRWRVRQSQTEGTFSIGQVITYNGTNGGGLNDTATIENVLSVRSGNTWYWDIYVNSAAQGNPPRAGTYLYVNYHQETTVNNNEAKFVRYAADCTGYDETHAVTLYGKTWTQTGNTYYTDYESNYLYWLAFHTSDAMLAEVTNWAATGSFRDDASGNPIIAGFYRQQVLKDVLKEVLNEVWAGNTNYNFGLYKFNPASAGAELLNNLQNANTPGVENAFRNSIDTIQPSGSTPLAEALADIWVYFKEGQSSTNYQPAGPDNLSGCGFNSGSSGHPETSCPIQNYCQKNYVIVMTDGTATHDNFGEAKYTDAANNIFLEDVSVWGDGDNHDPAHHGDYQPTTGLTPNDDGTPYCPEGTCWGQNLPGWGTDYLDDVAYYLKNNDIFPDANFPDMPGVQNIETFTIGFTVKNNLLHDTAVNGNSVGASAYYTSDNFSELKDNLVAILNNIQLREFGFSSITAPKKLTTTVGEGHSFVGYFVPSASSAIWAGHLQSYLLTDYWYVDSNGNDRLDDTSPNEYVNPYTTEANCETAPANVGKQCLRSIKLGDNLGPSEGGYEWDAVGEMTLPRHLFTHDVSPTMIPFTVDYIDTLKPFFQISGTVDEINTIAGNIIMKLNEKFLGDIFHSDLAYVGPPMSAKRYVRNLNPTTCGDDPATPKNDDTDCFEYLLTHNTSRTKVVYVGTNEGILHQVNAETGVERWGFIPDEVLPNLKTIINSNAYAYTVDGRLAAEDIYYRSGSGNSWKTILTFGLRDGGNSFYTLDVTSVSDQPTLLWKFNDETYSGKSWSKPYIGKVRLLESGVYVDRWVVIVAGGMAFNNEDTSSSAGKAVFVIDASSGSLLWMIGYNDDLGEVDSTSTAYIDTTPVGVRNLTKSADFNYPIPAAITPVDADQDGFLDSIYFGNVAGHLFKTDIKAGSVAYWRTYLLFKKDLSITGKPQGTISAIGTAPEGKVLTLGTAAKSFAVEQNIIGLESKAMGIIEATTNSTLTVTTISNAQFQVDELVYVPTFDPIFLSPAVAFDPCWNLWVCFGTGDRIRSRTNPDSGKFVAFRENTNTQTTNVGINDLVALSWTKTGAVWNLTQTDLKSTANKDKIGWQFTFPMASNHEKFFDPEPLVLPDPYMIPEIYFNTYQPSLGAIDLTNPCAPPATGIMYLYKIKNNYCGDGKVNGTAESGRIAGGGVFQGTDYLLYEGKGDVASIPPLQDTRSIKMIYTGSMLFWKEKKR